MKIQICNPVSRVREAITRARHNPQSHATPIDPSDAINILSSDRRCWAIEYLADHPPDSTITISDLSEYVAARESECSVEELSSAQRERVYVALYQSHLGSMASFIEYNPGRGTITPTEAPQQLWNAYHSFCDSLDG